MNPQVIGYVAGLFDGEGTVRFGKSSISLDLCSTDEDIIDRVVELSSLGKKYGPYNFPSMQGRKTQWFWKVERREEIISLISFISCLISVRRLGEFQKVLDYYEERTPKIIACWYCGNDFQQPHLNSRYCDKTCCNKAIYQRRLMKKLHFEAEVFMNGEDYAK